MNEVLTYPCTLVVIGFPKVLLNNVSVEGVEKTSVPSLFRSSVELDILGINAYILDSEAKYKAMRGHLESELRVSKPHLLDKDDVVVLLVTPDWKNWRVREC